MKQFTCQELKGCCSAIITGSTPEEMGDNSKRHVMEMMQAGDQAHKEAVELMMKMPPEEFNKWFDDFKQKFNSLPDA
ncbi:MAG: DUF1059 domain-containing protein [Patescibacteria group bacterium]